MGHHHVLSFSISLSKILLSCCSFWGGGCEVKVSQGHIPFGGSGEEPASRLADLWAEAPPCRLRPLPWRLPTVLFPCDAPPARVGWFLPDLPFCCFSLTSAQESSLLLKGPVGRLRPPGQSKILSLSPYIKGHNLSDYICCLFGMHAGLNSDPLLCPALFPHPCPLTIAECGLIWK